MKPTFATFLWTGIGIAEMLLVTARMFLPPGPLRLSMSLSIPGLIILGAAVNAIYNRITTGRALEAPSREKIPRY